MKNILFSSFVSIVTLGAVAVFAVTLLGAVSYGPAYVSTYDPAGAMSMIEPLAAAVNAPVASLAHASTASTSAVKAAATVPGYYPSRLVIPSIGIDAHVQYVGVTAAGDLGTPNNFTDVAWYDDGAVPGNTGSAVIDGHVDNGLGLSGVFKKLDLIKMGDPITVVDKNGQNLQFIVTSVAYYNYKDVPVNSLFNENDGKYLRLITCGGSWVPSGKTYDQRLVVTAVLKAKA